MRIEMEMTTLGDLISLQRGYDLTETQRRPGTIPIVGSAGVHGYHDTARAKGPGVALGRSGASFGKVSFVEEDYWPHNTTIFVTDFKGNEPVFIRYLLESLDFSSLNSGSAQQSLNRNYVYLVPAKKFPLPIQRRIAGILSAYDELIENSQRRIKILESMARALYREWFVHFRFPGHESVPRLPSALGDLPQGWEATDLAAVCDDDKGIQTGPFGSQLHEADYSDGGVPVVMPKDLIGFRIRTDSIAHIPEATADKLSRHRMKLGDIVYGRRGDIGRRAFIMPHQSGWFCGTGCLRIRPDAKKVNGWYLFNYLGQDDVVKLIAGRAQGVTMPNLNTGLLSSVPISLPPRAIQDHFARLSFSFAQAQEALHARIQTLRRTRDLLLPRLLSGGIEVLPKENMSTPD
jgi:type I restriction enzyme S subunit